MSHQTEWRTKLQSLADIYQDQGYEDIIESIESDFSILIAEAREEGIKFAEGMAIHQGEEKERTRVSKILKSKLEDMPSSADDSIYPLIVESRNKLINEALLAINVQDNGKS